MKQSRRAISSALPAAAATALLLVAACTGSSDARPNQPIPSADDAPEPSTAETSPNSTAPETTTTVRPTPPSTTEPAVVGAELAGRWAHYDVVAYEDGVLKTLIISYGFNDFSVVDGEIIDQASFCFSEQRTDQPIRTSLSDEATQAIRPPATPLTVTEAEAEADGTLAIRRDPTPTPVGIRLDDPANESLPTDRDDPRIVDDDGDGNPGITVTIEVTEDLVGELYIARREIFAYDATLVSPDRFEGVVTDDSEQLVVGASDPIFDQGDANWRQFTDPARNPIILVRVDDDWDCERLRAERDDLFPPTPVVDW